MSTVNIEEGVNAECKHVLETVLAFDKEQRKELDELAASNKDGEPTSSFVILLDLYRKVSRMVARGSFIDPNFVAREKENMEVLKSLGLYVDPLDDNYI